jgi:fatty acid desaturase
MVLSLLALEHLYHLEHHLHPQVPHHHWPELGAARTRILRGPG